VLGGDKGTQSLEALVNNLVSASEGLDRAIKDNSAQLNKIVDNVEAISSDVRGITAREKDNVDRIIVNVEAVSQDAREVARALREAVGGSADGGQPPGVSPEANSLREAI